MHAPSETLGHNLMYSLAPLTKVSSLVRLMTASCKLDLYSVLVYAFSYTVMPLHCAIKGIPLASCVATAWFDMYGEDKDVAYNRKEEKDHGEVNA